VPRHQIIALRASAKLPAGELPTRLVVLPWGTHQTAQGLVICNATTLARLPANQRARKFDRVALDFQHNTVPGGAFYKGEPAKVAAFATPAVIEGEGLVLEAIEWTEEGKAYAAAGHYPDLSPAVIRNEKGEVIFLHSAGLVRQGEVDGVTLFAASPALAPLLDSFSATQPNPEEETNAVYKELLLALLGLPAESTDEQIKAAAETFGKAGKPEAKPEAKPDDKVVAMSAELADLKTRLAVIEGARTTDERQALMTRAAAEGKVIPLSAEEIKQTPVDVLKTLVDKTPATVPLDQRTPGKLVEFSAGIQGAGIEDEVRKTLGISEDAWKKHNA
jgi:phage I-like protein